ncbi:hypothetical protein L6164_009792 [Bauhinia variegata]|uniref:Uncharacterized protein n=1 Tax=Bauhinia variegata TaxID=167791 RepID=A0ACB9PRF9_BAUVA|nr:hypothetical protein L6164_009792 [Bauhinia variegata]
MERGGRFGEFRCFEAFIRSDKAISSPRFTPATPLYPVQTANCKPKLPLLNSSSSSYPDLGFSGKSASYIEDKFHIMS